MTSEIAQLRKQWEKLEERDRRKILKTVNKVDADAITRLLKEMRGGFGRAKVLARDGVVAQVVDAALFRGSSGAPIERILLTYFTIVDATVNLEFNQRFDEIAADSRSATCEQVTNQVIAELRANSRPLVDLFEAALRIVTPQRYSEEMAVPRALVPPFKQADNPVLPLGKDEIPVDPPNTERPQPDRVAEQAELSAFPHIKSNKAMSAKSAAADTLGAGAPSPRQQASELVDHILGMPLQRALGEIDDLEEVFTRATGMRAAWVDLNRVMSSNLARLQERGLVSEHEVRELILGHARSRSLRNAVQYLREQSDLASDIFALASKASSQAAAIGHDGTWSELAAGISELDVLHRKIAVQAELTADAFARANQSHQLVLQLRDDLMACDFSAACELVEQMSAQQWRDMVLSALQIIEMYPGTGQPEFWLGARKFAQIIVSDQTLPIIANLMSRDDALSPAKLIDQIRGVAKEGSWGLILVYIRGLTWEHLFQLGSNCDWLADAIAELTIIESARRGDAQFAAWLQTMLACPNVRPSMKHLLQEVSAIQPELALAELQSSLNVLGAERPQSAVRSKVKSIEAHYGKSGWDGIFKRLRQMVQDEHLAPIVKQLQAGHHEEAMRRWRAAGDPESIVHECASRIQTMRKPSKQHIDKVAQYLRDFDVLMEDLEHVVRELTPGKKALHEALERYLEDAHRLNGVRTTLLEQSFGPGSASGGNPCYDRQISGPMFDHNSVDICVLLPCEVESMIIAAKSRSGRVAVSCLLAERVMNFIHEARANRPNMASLKMLAGRQEWAAARHLASIDPSLQPMLAEYLAPIQAALQSQHAEVLRAAKMFDQPSSELLEIGGLVEAAIANADTAAAQEYAAFLSEEISRLQQHSSPEYKFLRDYLIEAGIAPAEGSTIQHMSDQVLQLRSENIASRRHILYLSETMQLSDCDEEFRAPIIGVLPAIDRPRFWGSPATAKKVEDALKQLVKFVLGKSRLAQTHPEEYVQLCRLMARYIASSLREPLDSDDGRVSVENLDMLATAIGVDEWELREAVDKLAAIYGGDFGAEPPRAISEYVPARERVFTHLQQAQPMRTRSRQSPDGVVEDIRNAIRGVAAEYADASTPPVAHGLAAEQRKSGEWKACSRLMAKLAVEAGLEDPWPQAITAAACRDRLEAILQDPVAFDRRQIRDLVLGLGSVVAGRKHEQSGGFIALVEASDCVLRAIAAGIHEGAIDVDSLTDRRRSLDASLTKLRDASPNDERFKWLFDLLTRGNVLVHPDTGTSVSLAIVNAIWDEFAGYGDSARVRTTLLRLAFNMRMEDEFLLQLANVQLGQAGLHIPDYLKTVRNAETSPNASHEAYRLRQIILENLPPNKHRPWRHLIDQVGSLQGPQEEGDFCSISLESRKQDSNGMLVLYLCLAPLRRAIISSAVIVLKLQTEHIERESNTIELIREDASIAQEKIFSVRTPFAAAALGDEAAVISYSLTVENLMGQVQTIRSQWSIDHAMLAPDPFSQEVLKRNWPGAYGDPVSSRAFHGRVNELSRLRDCLAGTDGRQRSAVIIGQRRIGKTSLLLEAGKQYPPKTGHVCAIFSNLGSMDASAAYKSLKSAVFECLTDLGGERNAALRGILEDKIGTQWHRQLRRGLVNSISLASALDEFANRISHHTGQRIARVAFFVDEMQAIFKYDRQSVDNVMWALRELVQQSPTISLVLAGSGITRELTLNYTAALFGSIEQIHLRPFQFSVEADAIASTMIPKEVRGKLCPNAGDLEGLVAHAHLLTGGHPYFLAMLGRASATVLEGRPLSIPLLNEVARGMMQGDEDGGSTGGAEKFYGHLLDSLDVTGRGRYCAQLVLVNIAKQVTMEWPWLRSQEAMTGPAIARAELSPRECVDALKLLKHEDIIDTRHEHGEAQYRIKVPLVAQALRYHSNDLEHSAHLELTVSDSGS